MQYLVHKNYVKPDKTLKVHSGSWFGLPDFGVTEAIGGLFGAPKTAQGGSNILGPKQQASTLGTTTSPSILDWNQQQGYASQPYTPTTTSTSSGSGGTNLDPHINPATGVWDDEYYARQQQSSPDYAAQVRSDIDSGYNGYFSQLDEMMNTGLPQQQQAQEGIAQSQYDQGINTLGSQKTLGLRELGGERTRAEGQQNKTLKDLGDNIRNLFQSGNVYLGARGAGDSSAANQYAYALTKMGSKERGNVTSQYAGIQNDINDREFRLNETYNTEANNLKSMLDQKKNEVAQWFSEQTNALRMAKAQGQLSRGQDLASLSKDLLNVALQRLQGVEQDVRNRQSALQEWAMNNATNIQQLKSNLGQISSTNYQMPEARSVNGMPATAGGAGNPSLFGYGVQQDEQKQRNSLFG